MNKKNIVIIILIIMIVIIIIPTNESENIRIRVIGNSDTSEDISIKYNCVAIIKNIVNANDTKEQLIDKLPLIKKEIETYCSGKGVSATIEITKTKFPPKTLNGKMIDGGIYETLLIKLGKAEGSNYWTLLYPEYFNISFNDIYTGDVEIKWLILELLK